MRKFTVFMPGKDMPYVVGDKLDVLREGLLRIVNVSTFENVGYFAQEGMPCNGLCADTEMLTENDIRTLPRETTATVVGVGQSEPDYEGKSYRILAVTLDCLSRGFIRTTFRATFSNLKHLKNRLYYQPIDVVNFECVQLNKIAIMFNNCIIGFLNENQNDQDAYQIFRKQVAKYVMLEANLTLGKLSIEELIKASKDNCFDIDIGFSA